ncbi:hypothetical protein ACFYPT_42285 [Streptomyces sp. NPDC005529]|uniref:NHL domain-containing protein n=1 Tax=unclassified Streptomyces TaxID=2593676 RepID=UPI0033A484F7
MTTPIPTTAIPNEVWIEITNRLNAADLKNLISVNKDLYNRLSTNQQTWQECLASCTDTQLLQIAAAVPGLTEPVRRLLKLRTMTTLAGTGEKGFSGDDGPARRATLSDPSGVAVGLDGTVYIADTCNHRIRRIGADGIITTLAGTGEPGYGGDGGPAHQALLQYPRAVAVGPDGTVYIADASNYRIRRIGADGIITTLAGTGEPGYGGDGGPAHQALLRPPLAVAVGLDGTAYIADASNYRVRRIGADGMITTLAGPELEDVRGVGEPASDLTLRPRGVAVGPDGTVYIAEMARNCVRRITPDGIVSTVAGTGIYGFGGDGGPAEHARLAEPSAVAVGPDGTLYIADTDNYRVRRVGADGVITTLAGTGQSGFGGDGGPALQATLHYLWGVAVGPDSLVHVVTGSRLRRFGKPQC